MLEGKNICELMELQEEVELNLAQDRSFVADMQYWQNLLVKIKVKIGEEQILQIYSQFVQNNKEMIDTQIKKLREIKQ